MWLSKLTVVKEIRKEKAWGSLYQWLIELKLKQKHFLLLLMTSAISVKDHSSASTHNRTHPENKEVSNAFLSITCYVVQGLGRFVIQYWDFLYDIDHFCTYVNAHTKCECFRWWCISALCLFFALRSCMCMYIQ